MITVRDSARGFVVVVEDPQLTQKDSAKIAIEDTKQDMSRKSNARSCHHF